VVDSLQRDHLGIVFSSLLQNLATSIFRKPLKSTTNEVTISLHKIAMRY
jgi:hypothetical protein